MIDRLLVFFRTWRPRRRAGTSPRSGPCRVLLVYGEENVSHWLVNLLNRMDGLVCLDAEGRGEDLESMAARLEPDFIFLDARRLDQRSRNLVRRVKRRRPRTRVFLLGLDEGAGYDHSAKRAGADGYVSTTRVVESLEKILDQGDHS